MALNTNHHAPRTISSKKKLVFIVFLGTALLLIPVALVYIDPLLIYIKCRLRIDNGTTLHKLLLRPFQGMKIYVRVFNVTNAQKFLDGTDDKVKLEEVGPFVYQEIRTNEDVVINSEPGIMWYTPKMRAVFVPEESVGDPKNIYFTVPNVPFLSATDLIGKYPYLVRKFYNYLVDSTRSKAFERISLQDILWGYDSPLVALANKLVPGLVYYKSFGLLDRVYDYQYDYRLMLGTKDSDKFSVKTSTRIKPKNGSDSETFVEMIRTFPNNTYEGEVFPVGLSPDQPLFLHRPSTCLAIQFQYIASRAMFYGGDAHVYKLHNSTMNDYQKCDTKGWCPGGLMNLGPCYFDLPLVASKGHFLDGDPRLLDQVEGLKPDRNLHDAEFVIDPRVGVTISGTMSFQLNLFLSDMAFNPETRRLQDTVLPYVHYTVKAPKLVEEALTALKIVYKDGPQTLLTGQVSCVVLGLGLLVYAARLFYDNQRAGNRPMDFTQDPSNLRPLMS